VLSDCTSATSASNTRHELSRSAEAPLTSFDSPSMSPLSQGDYMSKGESEGSSTSPGQFALLKALSSHPVISGVLVTIIIALAALLWRTLAPSPLLEASAEVGPGTLEGDGFCSSFAVADSLADVPLPMPEDEALNREQFLDWHAETKAVEVGTSRVKVDVTGLSDRAVVLRSLDVVIDSSEPAETRTAYATDVDCGSGFSPSLFAARVDSRTPRVRAIPGFNEGNRVGPRRFPRKVSQGDPETFIIMATSKRKDVAWHLEIPWYSGKKTGTLQIFAPGGKPFETLGTSRVHRVLFPGDRGWQDYPLGLWSP
jgi:hypothetical protein